MNENKYFELKENISNSFLKTVSAFANESGGEIKFGIDDNGKKVGLDNLEDCCIKIENKINESLKPVPKFTLEVDETNNIIILHVYDGLDKPYFYNSKAYKRNDTSTIEVSRLELNRLILSGMNKNYEQLKSNKQDLTFNYFSKRFKEIKNIDGFNIETLKTLDLFDEKLGYNIVGELFSDQNSLPYIDIVRFGDTINIIRNRYTFNNMCILEMYDKAVEAFEVHYTYEEIKDIVRQKVNMIPLFAFREALTNAVVHRTWDDNTNIQISFYDDRIEIVSSGGLLPNISKENYLTGTYSSLRNPILANIFFRLNYIESFGTGIKRIMHAYSEFKNNPIFDIGDNYLKVILPVVKYDIDLTVDQMKVYNYLSNKKVSSTDVVNALGFGKNKTIDILKLLVEKSLINTSGNGRGKKYYKIN